MNLDNIRQFLTTSVGDLIYLYYALILMTPSLGFPCNSELLMVLGGSLAALGFMKLGIVLFISPLAILLGDTITFHLGKRYGETVLNSRLVQKLFPLDKQLQVRKILQDNAKKFIFSIRFVPVLRSFIFLTAGSMRIPSRIFFTMNGLSTFIYAPAIVAFSYLTAIGMQEWTSEGQSRAKWIAFGVVMIVMVYFFKKQRKVQLER
ncbi:MAG: DedA family protein [Bdellovibrionales bacterium]|nr:DedA family protein [Bdellovibrionales bacterium]